MAATPDACLRAGRSMTPWRARSSSRTGPLSPPATCSLRQGIDRTPREIDLRFMQAWRTARAPGRVNLIGDHTDYQDGLCMPMAIDRDVRVAFRPRTDD